MINEYLWYYLDNNKEQVFKCGRGTAQKAIDIDEFKSIKIPIPSLERQGEIVEYCEYNDVLIEQLKKEIENNKNQAKLFLERSVKTYNSISIEEINELIDEILEEIII
jgi:restriction endonuclease S subunit